MSRIDPPRQVSMTEIVIYILFQLKMDQNRCVIEVRDSQTGVFIPARYGMGVWPDGKIVGASSSSSPPASSRKCTNMRKCALFHKWACQTNPEIMISKKKNITNKKKTPDAQRRTELPRKQNDTCLR